MRLPAILMYHAVAPCPSDADKAEQAIFVHPEAFERQMGDLASRGFRSLTLDKLAAYLDGTPIAPRSFLLTFDDAYAHVDEVVTPMLRRHDFTAVMFANWEHLGGLNTWDRDHPNLARLRIASREQLVDMSLGPWEIGSHNLRHVDLSGIDREARREELTEARERLSHLVKTTVRDLAYPYGYLDAAVIDDARLSGYRLAFGALPTGSVDPLQLPRQGIIGTDSMRAFRLKTGGWSGPLHRVSRVTPGWALRTARSLLKVGAR